MNVTVPGEGQEVRWEPTFMAMLPDTFFSPGICMVFIDPRGADCVCNRGRIRDLPSHGRTLRL